MIAGALIVRVQGHNAPADGDLRLRACIPFVGFCLILGADALVHNHANLIVLGGNDIHGAAHVGDVQAGSGGKGLRELVVKVVLGSEHRKIAVVVDVDLVFELSPVDVGSLGRDQPDNDDAQ